MRELLGVVDVEQGGLAAGVDGSLHALLGGLGEAGLEHFKVLLSVSLVRVVIETRAITNTRQQISWLYKSVWAWALFRLKQNVRARGSMDVMAHLVQLFSTLMAAVGSNLALSNL